MAKRVRKLILMVVLLAVTILVVPSQLISSASQNITIEQYIELLIKAMKVTVDSSEEDPYIAAALKTGLLENDNEFTYTKQMTRTECAVLTNRADIYINGNEVTKLYDNIVNLKRISDLNKVTKKYRADVVQVFGKGIIVGYTNGKCTQDREFKGSNDITYNGAKAVITKLIDTKKRSVMSPDGQLTRTTKLPVNAKEFDYILASFPNDFYEMKFYYELGKSSSKYVMYEDYCAPAHMKDMPDYNGTVEDTRKMLDTYLYQWCNVVEKNLYYRFNVNYKTVDTNWVKNLRNTYYFYGNDSMDQDKTDDIKDYVKELKKNKVIIKSTVISVEPSTLYYEDFYYIRAYVKFKVTSASDVKGTLMYGKTYMPTLKKNQWHEGYYDIALNGGSYSLGDDFKVSSSWLNDSWMKQKKTKILQPTFNKRGDSDFPNGYYYFK